MASCLPDQPLWLHLWRFQQDAASIGGQADRLQDAGLVGVCHHDGRDQREQTSLSIHDRSHHRLHLLHETDSPIFHCSTSHGEPLKSSSQLPGQTCFLKVPQCRCQCRSTGQLLCSGLGIVLPCGPRRPRLWPARVLCE